MTNFSQGRIYHRIKNWILIGSLLLEILALLIVFIEFSSKIKNIATGFLDQPLVINGIYISLFSLGAYLLHFPLSWYSGYVIEHRFNLSNQTLLQWFKDDMKKSALSFTILFLLVEVGYFLLGRYPETWWIFAGAFWFLLTFLLAKITPQVIIPLFYKYLPINNQILKNRIFQLFKGCRVSLKDIYAIDFSVKTKKANAFLCGVGKSRRVVLSDTLLENFSNEEIEVVVAHELGHFQHRDILKMLVVNALVTFCGLYLVHEFLHYAATHMGEFPTTVDNIELFPLIALSLLVFGLVTAPFINSYSRRIERAADRFSLQKTGKVQDFITLMEKLGRMNLAEEKPGRFVEFFLYDHPPIYKRIAFARQFKL